MRLLRRYRRMFPGKELLVIENGSVERADGVERADYLRSHLREVQRAVRAGIPVAAYICWSITTNREWGLPLGADSDFGLYRIDLDTDPALKRIRTPAADAYAAIIRERDWRAGQRPVKPLLSRIVEKARRRIRRRP
jgi:beta-glucosidase/6-phospho-beta-glucosidase/beta-galactosidase